MREFKVASAALGLILGVLAAVPASAWDRRDGDVANLVLPALVDANGNLTNVRGRVEGLTVGPDNRIYAASRDAGTIANLFVFDANGNFYNGQNICAPPPAVPCSVRIQNSTTDVLGIRFNPNNQAFLWVLDGGDCFAPPPCTPPQILEVNPATGNSTRLAITFQNDARLNGITFDGAGNAYVSDSNLGRIYQIPVGNPGGTNIWSSGSFMGDPLLRPAMPPGGITPTFGANGIEFMPLGCTPGVTPGCVLLVANTANRTILQMTCCDMNNRANPETVLLNAVNGPDGIAIDPATGFIWVAANQSDEIVAIQPSTGPNALPRVIAKLGDFNGIAATQDGGWRVRGLLFPSSLAFSNLNPPPPCFHHRRRGRCTWQIRRLRV